MRVTMVLLWPWFVKASDLRLLGPGIILVLVS